ncbi:polysaccharide deacetylase family protein [Lutibacter sp.]|jgi:peptidoglycan/xylan/chitin deacetylase (PgdA/CDA1 family)|uniref:polysaccharide deacetylase family protein n=1 Tax=Lutibacter sp. TaxID=1925666 RepID=UPI001A34C32F|nr:polysaccharide deacetylase family protein [Lutibacter sp.]MBI9040121.1 polysaccharide deacetylase family protein [Lutibacter sp.]
MKKYFVKTPYLLKLIFNNWVWSFSKKEKVIYLTFDDGPTPEITEWTLQELKKYQAKATFFCIGKNVVANPEIFKKIIDDGHSIGNHTHNHLNGRKTSFNLYIDNILKAETTIKPATKLFRPPYGKLTLAQSFKLRKLGYKIIMWDVLSADFDNSITNKKCLENVIKNTENGSVLIFHDSVKATKKLQYVLPLILDYYTAKNYRFEKITA